MTDRTNIVEQARLMKTKEGLLSLLNLIMKGKLGEAGAEKFNPFKIRQLTYYSNPNHVMHRYRQFEIKKKSGGIRTITAPRSQTYRALLECVNELLKAMYTPSEYAMGFAEGRSVVTNAQKHIGQNYVFNIDLKDFFPSVKESRVCNRLQLKPFEFTDEVALTIAGLCSKKETRKDEEGKESVVYVLPQGAPTSPIITNMVCDKLDRRLAGVAKRFGLHYSRYADDITFSSMHNVYAEGGEFRTELESVINEQGFTINEAKTRLQKRGSRQEVTGLVVGQKVNVTQKYMRDLRNLLYIWEQYGYDDARKRFLQGYDKEKGRKKSEVEMRKVIRGRLMWMKMVRGANDSTFVRMCDRFTGLLVRDGFLKNNIQIKPISTEEMVDVEDLNNDLNLLLEGTYG